MGFIPGQRPNQVKYCTDAKYLKEKKNQSAEWGKHNKSFHVTVVVLLANVSAQLFAEGMC